jgi:hypothetical protein
MIEVYRFYENWSTETFRRNSEEARLFERVVDEPRPFLSLGSPPAAHNETNA